jgi:hypothetical protein
VAGRREERLRRDAEREAAERRQRRIGYVVAAGLVLATVAVVAFALASGGGGGGGPVSKRKLRALDRAAALANCRVRSFPSEGRRHTRAPVTYRTNPPTSGPHDPVPAGDGEYDRAPAKEAWVHSLEHGRILLQYRPGAPGEVRGALKAVFDQDRAHMLLMPNDTAMPFELAAVAWTHYLGCASYDDRVPDAVRAFRDAYRDRAPEQVP